MNQQTIASLAPLVSNDTFELIILPTEACNFRCTYCYEDFTLGAMSPAVVRSVKNFLSRRAVTAENITLSWFGGEPLLAKDVVLDVSNHVMNIVACKRHAKFNGTITTNGYLLTPWTIAQLASAGILYYQIALDGPRQRHNLTRRLNHGDKGTFDTIWKNLLEIRDSILPLSVLLRVHFDAYSYRELEPLIEDICQELLPSNRFTIFFRELSRLGGPNDADIPVLSESEKRTVLERLYSLSGTTPYQKKLENYVCYASRANSLVIRSNGTVAKCTVAFRDQRNHIGSLNPDGTLDIKQDRLALWLRGLMTMEKRILACPLRGLPA